MKIQIPEFSVVVVIGTSGSGKSTFCKKHFLPTEILSSDAFRGLVSDDENRQDISGQAFEALHFVLEKRLELGRLTVIDATNVQKESRAQLLRIASKWHALKVAIVIDTPEEVCLERNKTRPDRQFGPHVIRNQYREMRRSFGAFRQERWHKTYTITPENMEQVVVERERSWTKNPDEHGPFDIIGDVHGCIDELRDLLNQLGWQIEPELSHPKQRKLIFVGDLVDRGPDSVGVLRLVMDAVERGIAYCVPGNHDIKLVKALRGQKVQLNHGLDATMAQLSLEHVDFRKRVQEFLYGLVSHQVLDDGKLCVAHAGLKENMQGRGSAAVREFCMYGETTGEIDEFGLPVRQNWAKDYDGHALVVFGHTPVPQAEFFNNTIDIDTGCCFGGKLSALKYPEREVVCVSANRTYVVPARPLDSPATPFALAIDDGILDIEEVLGRRSIETELHHRITIREENAIAALEVMSRFAVDPRWLIYLPPTMSPCQTSLKDGYLEHPDEALDYYRKAGVTHVVCQEKHMGSRAIAIVTQQSGDAEKRFGVPSEELGIITTRTGRRFFNDAEIVKQILVRLRAAAEKANLFTEFNTSWLLLDLELMPWSAKAMGLLQTQYAPVSAAANHSANARMEIARKLQERGIDGATEYYELAQAKQESVEKYRDAYRRYCWNVTSVEDYKLAPFHLLASEGAVHSNKSHLWHMEKLKSLCAQDPAILRETPFKIVELDNKDSWQDAVDWWMQLTNKGGEGMVVKPLNFLEFEANQVLQPAIKCRGPEYLRIIYGPEYLLPANLDRLRRRGISRKRALASREFALGLEGLQRFVGRESIRRVHECVFGVLALESEPVDPRL